MLKNIVVLATVLFVTACATAPTGRMHTCTHCTEKHCTHEKECKCGCNNAEMVGKSCQNHMNKTDRS